MQVSNTICSSSLNLTLCILNTYLYTSLSMHSDILRLGANLNSSLLNFTDKINGSTKKVRKIG